MSKARSKSKRKKSKTWEEDKENLAYKVLSKLHTEELLEIETVEDVQQRLADIIELANSNTDLKEGAELDYFTTALWWSREQGFTVEQTSAFFTLVKILLVNIKEKHMCLSDNLKEYRKLLAGIGQETPELRGGLECFDIEQAKAISEYIYFSLFQHHLLYEYMFSTTQAEEIIGTDLTVEVPLPSSLPWPPPLEEAVTKGIYGTYIDTQEASDSLEKLEIADEGEEPEVTHTTDGEAGASDVAATDEQLQKEADLLSRLTHEDVKTILQSVMDEVLTGVKEDIAQKLRDKENAFLTRINKIHKVSLN